MGVLDKTAVKVLLGLLVTCGYAASCETSCLPGEIKDTSGCCVLCPEPKPDSCPKGTGIQKTVCGAKCEPCPAHEYNDGSDTQCKACKDCNLYKRDTVQPGCRQDANTICGNCFKGYHVPKIFRSEFDNPSTQECQRCYPGSKEKDCQVSTTTRITPRTTPPTTTPTTTPTTPVYTTRPSEETTTKKPTTSVGLKDKKREENLAALRAAKKPEESSTTYWPFIFEGIIIVILIVVIALFFKFRFHRKGQDGSFSSNESSSNVMNTSTSSMNTNQDESTSTSGSLSSKESIVPLLKHKSDDQPAKVHLADETTCISPLLEKDLKQKTEPYNRLSDHDVVGFRLSQLPSHPATELHIEASQSTTSLAEDPTLPGDDVFAPNDSVFQGYHAQETKKNGKHIKRRHSSNSSSSKRPADDKTRIYDPSEDSSGYEDNVAAPTYPMKKSESWKDLLCEAQGLQVKDKVISQIPYNAKVELAKDLDPEDSGVKGWKQFGEELGIDQRDLKNLAYPGGKTLAVLNIAGSRRLKVDDILKALVKIKQFDALHRLCKALISDTEPS